MLLLLVAGTAWRASGQRDYLRMPPPDSAVEDDVPRPNAWAYYASGVAAFEKGAYARAERDFRKAFGLAPDEENARYLYYTLLYQGLDLEADAFKNAHATYTFALPPARRGLESVYADIGPRLPAAAAVGTILYSDAGAFCRLGSRTRLWQAATYLQRDAEPRAFRQGNYFASLVAYGKRGWYLSPSVHFAYVSYDVTAQATRNVTYTASYAGPRDTLVYTTGAVQTLTTDAPGHTGFLHLSLPVTKRWNAWTAEVEPALHLVSGRGSLRVAYTSIGTTDSAIRGHVLGSQPFQESGTTATDTSYAATVYQAGTAVSRAFRLGMGWSGIRAAVYGLWGGGGAAAAVQVNATLGWTKNYRLFLSYLSKGSQPLHLRNEGQYFNFNDPIDIRAAVSVQWHPFRRFAPLLTYQYERDTRLQDAASVVYHSLYLTLKYNL